MAPLLYSPARESFGKAEINWPVAVVHAYLIDSADYTVSAAHQFLSSVPAGARVGGPVALTAKVCPGGVFDAADVTFPSVTGDQSEALILVQASAPAGGAVLAEAAQRLIYWTDSATGLPVTPSAVNIVVTWNASGIFKL